MSLKKEFKDIETNKIYIKDRELLYKWLRSFDHKYKTDKYEMVETPTYCKLNILGDFDVSMKYISWIPFKIQFLSGSLNISNNHLTDLTFCPDLMMKNLNARRNNLTSLKGIPSVINGSLDISNNPIENLYYFPDFVEGIVNMMGCDKLITNEISKDFHLLIHDFNQWSSLHIQQKNILDNEMITEKLDLLNSSHESKNKFKKL